MRCTSNGKYLVGINFDTLFRADKDRSLCFVRDVSRMSEIRVGIRIVVRMY